MHDRSEYQHRSSKNELTQWQEAIEGNLSAWREEWNNESKLELDERWAQFVDKEKVGKEIDIKQAVLSWQEATMLELKKESEARQSDIDKKLAEWRRNYTQKFDAMMQIQNKMMTRLSLQSMPTAGRGKLDDFSPR